MPRRAVAAALAALLLLSACPRKALPLRPVRGGTLSVALRDLGSLDPAHVTGPGAQLVIAQLFEPLTAIDPATHGVVPAAASSWEVSKDGLRWLFRIRKAKFSNGASVTAGDFKLAFDRLARKATASDAAFQLEQVRGFHETHDTGTAPSLSGVAAPAPTRLVIVLARPFADLPYMLAHPRLGPLPVGRYRNQTRGIDTAPIGNGPFQVKSARLGVSAELVRNPAYDRRVPYLDGMSFRVAKTIDEGWRAFTDGDVQVAEIPVEVLQAGGTFGKGGFTAAWATLSFGPNLALAKYRSPEVRRALSLAIDRDSIARTVYGGTKAPATGIIPDGVRGFHAGACAACEFDRDRARNIIVSAFGAKPPAITIDHLAEESSRAVARAVQAGFEAVGLTVKLRAHSLEAYKTFLAAGRQDFAQLGWLADVPTPDGFLAQQLRTGSPNNEVAFKDAQFDGLIDRARAQLGDAARLVLYQHAEQRALDLMPLIPIVFFRNRTAVAPRVHGFTLDGAGSFDGTTVWLARR